MCRCACVIATSCDEFTGKDEWPQNSPHVNPFDYHVWGVMFEHCRAFHPKPKNTDGLKKVLQLIWVPAATGLSQQGHTELHKKRLPRLCESWDGHFEINCLTTLNIERHNFIFWHNFEIQNRIL